VNSPYAEWKTVEEAQNFAVEDFINGVAFGREMIPRFIELGMDALQTIQPQAYGMDPYDLKCQFHGRIVLHGAVDVQRWLQKATSPEIREEIEHLVEEVGKDGGFIIAPCHQIQPNTPLENVLALYRTLAARRAEKAHPLLTV
jgi:uroporphyrinogen decarboxylase